MNTTDTAQPIELDGDTAIYKWTALALRIGMLLSVAMLLAGIAWWLLLGAPVQHVVTRIMEPGQIVSALAAGDPLALLNLGLLLLLITPAASLLVQLLTFALSRNWRFVGITAITAAIILLSVSISEGWLGHL